jgi:hypothetical protein
LSSLSLGLGHGSELEKSEWLAVPPRPRLPEQHRRTQGDTHRDGRADKQRQREQEQDHGGKDVEEALQQGNRPAGNQPRIFP